MEHVSVKLGGKLLQKIDDAAENRDITRSEKIRSDLNQKYFED
jgi:metal-responsive CopG/Arc/MetJ family transcriptional regulator